MRSLVRRSQESAAAATHIVCLPGAYHEARDFLSAGFDACVRERDLPIDLSFVDLDMQHLGDRRPLERLRQEIVLPIRTAGCRSLWFAGISLGGFIALDYADCYPGDVDGLCLLAPYLGNRMLIADVARAPRLGDWAPGELAESDEERRIWRFLKTRCTPLPPPVYLGYGSGDRFADVQRLLAGSLPPAAVDVVSGGHDWPTWRTLWENFLASRFA